MNYKTLLAATSLLASALTSMSAMAGPTFTMKVPLHQLAVAASSGGTSDTVNPSGAGGTTTPVEPVPEPTPPRTPQKYTFTPANNESFYIPADATGQKYDYYILAAGGSDARYGMYQDGVLIYSTGCGCSATWGTYDATNPFVKLMPGHTYRFSVTAGTLATSKVTYTQ